MVQLKAVMAAFGHGKVPGVITHDPAGVRRTLIGLGTASIAGAGVGGYFALQSDKPNPWAIAGASAGAVAGVTMMAVGALKFHKVFMPYLDGALYSSVDQAVDGAAKYSHDIGVHKQPEGGGFGLLDLKEFDVDNAGVASVDLGNQHVDLPAIRTRDGDVHREMLDHSYVNTGVRPAERIDIGGATALTPEIEAKLVGAKLGTNEQHEALTLGKRISPDGGFSSRVEAEQWGFEQGVADVATVQTGKQYHVFALDGPQVPDTFARGRQVKPAESVTMVSGQGTYSAMQPGDAYGGTALTRLDMSKLTNEQARALTGRRVALGGSSDVIRVGKLTDEFDSRAAAESALFDRGGEHLMVDHDGKSLVYELDHGSAIDASGSTILGKDRDVRLFRGAYARGVHDRGLTRMAFEDVRKVPVADAAKFEGQRLAGTKAPYVSLGKLQGTYPDVASANRAARETNREQVVVQMTGGYARFDVEGKAPRSRESASRLGPDDAVRNVLERKQYAPDGPEWEFAGRSVPFEQSEPIGYDIFGEGGAYRHISTHNGASAAQDRLIEEATLSTSYGAVHGNGNEVHVYELGGSTHGRWDEELGRIEGAASRHYNTDVRYDEHDVPYPYQNWQNAYVEKIDLRRDWTRLETHSGTSTHRDTGWRETDRNRDWSRTNDLQNRRRNEYENWKRQQEANKPKNN